ncbi:DUF1269 domain-containing protein [Herbiconiux sp. CPCC 203407]|uniref:DUF1269 domain-containing protein n=1 Tax=Herbiconiux oxytropis TaxID=2970915 RepID=A0AA42BTD2_9MICO|nr:DUF1269 domain-containing protein [Herbiconiux oxytropis]MCS5720627.1 DUF1269 domain-containing protein [Herbiconiux oxytropis]MCS5725046.1 DUF1269 domain-containing protein [Herbiconiux oxytropis]
MTERNLVLVVGAYDDPAAAERDFAAVRALDDTSVVAAVVLSRSEDGRVRVEEHGGRLIAVGTALGAVAGLAVGLFAPPLLLLGVVGAGAGAGVSALVKRHEENTIGVDAEEWLPAGSSAIVVVLDDVYLDRVDAAIEHATKKLDKAIDHGDYRAVAKAVDEGDKKILDALMR